MEKNWDTVTVRGNEYTINDKSGVVTICRVENDRLGPELGFYQGEDKVKQEELAEIAEAINIKFGRKFKVMKGNFVDEPKDK